MNRISSRPVWATLGSFHGFGSTLAHLPDKGITVAVLTNRDDSTPTTMAIAEALIQTATDAPKTQAHELPPTIGWPPEDSPRSTASCVEAAPALTHAARHSPICVVAAGPECSLPRWFSGSHSRT